MFGFAAVLIGGFAGGYVYRVAGTITSLWIAGLVQMLSNLMFVAQALVGANVPMLMVTIAAENITSGMATTAFVAYLSSLCNQAYTATQYALLSSFMAFTRDVLSASAGWVAEWLGWIGFFLFSAAAAVPGLAVLLWLMRRYPAEEAPEPAGV